MHELSIAMRIVDIVSEVASQNKVYHIESVNLEIGELTSIVPDALTFAFEAAAKDTCMENAFLKMKIIPCKAVCNMCREEFCPGPYFTVCPACESSDCEVINGKELSVISIVAGSS